MGAKKTPINKGIFSTMRQISALFLHIQTDI
jgi:hypothetical protein